MTLIPLNKGKFAKVSDHRYDFLNQWKWYLIKKGYAVRMSSRKDHPEGKRKLIYMHLVIHPSPKGMDTDHKDGDELNNQDGNLRTGTHQQNIFNKKPDKNCTSKYKGVSWKKTHKKWQSQIMANGKIKYLGYFDIEIEAAMAYDKAALKYFEEFAYLNFPQEVLV